MLILNTCVKCTSKQYFSPKMELWTGLMIVLVSALRSRLPMVLTGIDTDSREPWCLRKKMGKKRTDNVKCNDLSRIIILLNH